MIFYVLSGGGARALAHVGALKALEEQGYKPEAILGVSMGALIGAGYAALGEADALYDIAKRSAAGFKLKMSMEKFSAGNFSKALLFLGCAYMNFFKSAPFLKKKLKIIDRIFGDLRFEDLKIKLYVLTADLRSGEAVVIKSGLVSEAVKASMSIPGLFPPVEKGDARLVDGGVVNNLPVSVAHELGGQFIVALDAGKKSVSNPRATANSYLLIMDAFREAAMAKIEAKKASIYVDYGLDDVDSLDFSRGIELIDIGYRKTLEVLKGGEDHGLENRSRDAEKEKKDRA